MVLKIRNSNLFNGFFITFVAIIMVYGVLLHRLFSSDYVLNYSSNINVDIEVDNASAGAQDWGIKYRPIRVWCCIKTIYNAYELLIIQETWGKYCDKLLFFVGDNQQKHIEEVNIKYDDGDAINNIIRLPLQYTGDNLKIDLWEKTWKTYEYLYEYHVDEFEWIVMADTDAWFSTYNFKGYAQYFNPNQSWYMGSTLTHDWRTKNIVSNAGGVFALSQGSIAKLHRIFKTDEFLNGPRSERRCTAYGSRFDDVHLALCLKSIGVFPINSLDEHYRARWSIFQESRLRVHAFETTEWYWIDRFEHTGIKRNCCATHPIAFHYYKTIETRRSDYMHLDEKYTEKSRDNWFNHPLPPQPTTFLFNTSFTEFDEYFNVKNPPPRQKIWKGIDNLWNYTMPDEAVNITKSLMFMDIPQTGGTSIVANAKKHGIFWGPSLFLRYKSTFNRAKKELCAKMHMHCPQCGWHIPLRWWTSYFSSPNTTRSSIASYYDVNQTMDYFCVVRHPFTKMIAEYKYLPTNGDIYGKAILLKEGIVINNASDYCNEQSLNIWIQKAIKDYRSKTQFQNYKHYCYGGCHFVKQYDFIYDGNQNQLCKHVIRYENLEEEITALFRTYGLALQYTFKWTNDDIALGSYCSDSDLDVYNLTTETKTIIFEFYKQDFASFGYDFV
eukprot:69348_1